MLLYTLYQSASLHNCNFSTIINYRFNVTPLAVDPALVSSFPYDCSGTEEHLKLCKDTHTTCSYRDNNAADIVTISCGDIKVCDHHVTMYIDNCIHYIYSQ